jgi:signal peptidase I
VRLPATQRAIWLGWARIAGAGLARVLLVTAAGLALWATLPALIGWQPTTVMSDSMAPRIRAGDVVAARPTNTTALRPGMVLLAEDPDHPGRLRLHRYVRPLPGGSLVLRGDANPSEDSSPVHPGAVRGVGVLRVPYAGLGALWTRQGHWERLALLLAVGVALVLATRLDRGTSQPAGPTPPPPSQLPGGGQPTRPDRAAVATPAPGTPAGAAQPTPPIAKEGTASSSARDDRRDRVGVAAWAGLAASATVAVALPAGSAVLAAATTNPASGWATRPYYTCAAAVAAASPYLYYRFDEPSGENGTTAADSSGNARHGTYQRASVTYGVPRACTGDTGTAVTLHGTQYVSTPTLIAVPPDTFTLEIWFKTTTTTGGKLIGMGSSQVNASPTVDRHLYMTNAGTIAFGVNPATTPKAITSPNSYNDGAWHHVAATLSTAGLRLYLDGQQVAADPATTTGGMVAGYWRIGYDTVTGWPSAPSSANFTGTIDDAAIYTTALTATTISAHHQAGR